MKPERRSTHREKPEKLSYIQFEPEGGGIVVNASEQGLAFHVATALRQPGPIRLSISPNPMQQIKLAAEIAWIDETKKSGGLRFTKLTADAGNQIRQWLAQTSGSETLDGKLGLPSGAPSEESEPCAHAPNGTSVLLSPIPIPVSGIAMRSRADAAGIPFARFSGIPTATLLPAPFSPEKQISISCPRPLRRVATGFLIFAFVFMPILLLQNFRREIGNSLIRMGEKLKGNGDSQPDAPSSIPVQISIPSSGSTASAPNPIREAPTRETLDQLDPAASTQTTRGTVNSTDSRIADPQNSRQRFADAHSRRGRSALARQLWSALRAGDSSAEVTLAQLYLTGDGVPRNCEQARVLLRAASKNGNIQALRQLRKLNESACQ
jgi:hypothetical protein